MRSLTTFLVVLTIFDITQSALISYVRLREPERKHDDDSMDQLPFGLPMTSIIAFPVPSGLIWPLAWSSLSPKVKKTNNWMSEKRPLRLYKREYRTPSAY